MFDPYRKWLGIPPKDQPPNHYRLLGLELFESDLDVIEGSADKQMGFVRQYQSGEHASDAAKVLNELAVARLCLLKPAAKAAYDEKLRTVLAPPEAAPRPEFPDESFADVDLNTELAPRRQSTRKSRKTKSTGPSLPLMIGGGVAAVVGLILIVLLFSGGRKRGDEKPDKVASTKSATPNVGEVKPESPTRTKGVSPSDVAWSESKLMTEPTGAPVDLLKLVEVQRDVVAGEWKQTNTAMIGSRHSRMYLPVKLPEDYQLKISARPLETSDTLMIGFMMAGRQGMVAIDIGNGTMSGLYVDGRDATDNGTIWRGKAFADQSVVNIVLTVHPGHLHVALDGKKIIDWHGNPERLYLHSDHGIASRESPFIETFFCKHVIESASLVPIKLEPIPSRPNRLDREVDVLPLVDLDRDAQRGIRGINKNSLYSPEGMGQIYLSTVVPEEYTLSTTVTAAPRQHGDALTIGLVAGKSYFQFVSTDAATGLDLIDGRRWESNETRFSGTLLKPQIPVRIDCTVTTRGVRIDVDGKTLIDWRGDVRRLSNAGDWALSDGRRLYVGATRHLKFRDIKLGPPLPALKLPEHPPASVGKPVDLLAMIDPKRDAWGGTWERDGASLKCRGDAELNKLAIPFDLPQEYKLTARITRIEGGSTNTQGLILGFPIAQTKAVIAVDAYDMTISAPFLDDLEIPDAMPSYRGKPVLPLGMTREVVIHVRNTGIQLTSEGTTIFDWKGNPARSWISAPWAWPGSRLMLGSFHGGFRFEKLQLEALPPTSFPAVAQLGVDGKLPPILNMERDSRRAGWILEGSELRSPVVRTSRLRIPATVPARYKFTVNVKRLHGDNELFLGFVVGGHHCSVVIDSQHSRQAGINLLDGKGYTDRINFATRKYQAPLLPPNQLVPIQCHVLPDTIVVTCGDKEVIRWHGDPRRLSDVIPQNYSDADWQRLWLGALDSAYSFHDLELKPLTDAEAEKLTKSFSGVFPTTSQADIPLGQSAGIRP